MLATRFGAETASDGESHLPDDLRTAFLAIAHPSSVRRNQIVISEGIFSSDVYLILSGRVKVTLFSRRGHEQILREMGPNEIFGELSAIDRQRRSSTVIAVEDTRLAHLSGDEFIRFLAETPRAGLWMARQLSVRIRDLTGKIFALATMPVSIRVQCHLMDRLAAARAAGEQSARIAPFPTHSELAKTIGTHREAVTRELRLLAKEGIIHQNGRELEVLSVPRLEALVMRYIG